MKKQILSSLLILSFATTGCSTMKESLTLGITTGAITGATTQLALTHTKGKIPIKGILTGSLLFGIASYFIHKGLEKRDSSTRKDTLFNLEKFGVYGQIRASENSQAAPYSLSPAMVERDYVETHVEDGRRLIEGHRVWSISQDSQWIPTKKSKE